MCSWTLPCVSSLVPSVLHLSHGFQCSPTLNHQPYKGRLPLTSWRRKSSNIDSWPVQPDILSPPLLRLTSRKPLWLDLQLVDIKSRWRYNWKSAQVVNSHLVCDPTIRQLGFDLPRQQWSLLNRFCKEQGHCGACRRKWRLEVMKDIFIISRAVDIIHSPYYIHGPWGDANIFAVLYVSLCYGPYTLL